MVSYGTIRTKRLKTGKIYQRFKKRTSSEDNWSLSFSLKINSRLTEDKSSQIQNYQEYQVLQRTGLFKDKWKILEHSTTLLNLDPKWCSVKHTHYRYYIGDILDNTKLVLQLTIDRIWLFIILMIYLRNFTCAL